MKIRFRRAKLPTPTPDEALNVVDITRWHQRFRTGVTLVVLTFVGIMVTVATLLGVWQRQYLVECTTPGSREPTAENPNTGHECFDRGNERAGEFLAPIVDANSNGQADLFELAQLQGTPLPPPSTSTTIPGGTP